MDANDSNCLFDYWMGETNKFGEEDRYVWET